MSHGCDFADFEAIIGPMPRDGPGVEQHILFLLENPGKDYGNGAFGVMGWSVLAEISTDRISHNLMWRHQLTHVYITNLVKCKYLTSEGDPARTPSYINKECVDLYLRREIEYFDPKLVVCFGRAAERGFKFAYPEISRIKHVYLYHPSYISARWQTARKRVGETIKEKVQNALIKENDELLRGAIEHIV